MLADHHSVKSCFCAQQQRRDAVAEDYMAQNLWFTLWFSTDESATIGVEEGGAKD